MKERPILFSAPMVRATLNGSKTQTRRMVKPPPPADCQMWAGWILYSTTGDDVGKASWNDQECPLAFKSHRVRCPYGQPGDLLWGRETWKATGLFAGTKPADTRACGRFAYSADAQQLPRDNAIAWRPSIHMPRWASRLNLEVTGIRVERLHDISEADALAEGIACENVIIGANCNGGVHTEETADRYFWEGCQDEGFETAVEAYADLWEHINGPGSWDANSWVWVVEYRRLP